MPAALPRPPRSIDAARTALRLVERGDLPALLAVNGDDETTRFLPYATWRTLADAEAWFDRMEAFQSAGGTWQFVVVDTATAVPIGTCLVFRHDIGSARAEIGYVLGRAHWGRGMMREALGALVGWCFGAAALRRLEAEVDRDNERSARLMRALGFVEEGLLRERWVAKGEARDMRFFGLLRSDMQARKMPGV